MTDIDAANTRVLLVDDNDDTALILQTMLEVLGLDVDLANNGQIACEMAAAARYAAILMDIEMPEMDGLAATQAIRLRERETNTAAVPILGISGHTATGIRVLSERAGMNDMILKPFRPETLREKLISVCADIFPE